MDFLCRLISCCFRTRVGVATPLNKSELLLLVKHYDIDYTITDLESGEEMGNMPIEDYNEELHAIELESAARLARTFSGM